MVETILQYLALLLVVQSVAALSGLLRFARYALRWRSPHHRYQPKAVVIVPCKGLEPELEENIRALCTQDYREYELIFVTESESDPAHALISKVIRESRRAAWLLVAGEAVDEGQKIHNLKVALETLDSMDRRTEVLVFADSDARPAPNWLSELVSPLDERRVGASTGFRWYLPARGGLCSLLLSIWNGSALSLLGERSSFAWGGATAIRRENFERLGIRAKWAGALSDDYVLTRAVEETGQRIKFVPACLSATRAGVGLEELLEFTTRQMRITRVYAPRVWTLALVSQLLYNVVFWGGTGWVIASLILGRGFPALLASLIAIIFLLGAATGWARAMVASALIAGAREEIRRTRWAFALLTPLASALYLVNLAASAWNRRIVWRGIGYELVSASETRILHRPKPEAAPESAPPAPRHRQASAGSKSAEY